MKITLELPKYKKTRIWLDEFPEALYTAENVFHHSVSSSDTSINDTRSVAIEVLIAQGPRALYGLLGAKLVPSDEETIVKIHTSSNDKLLFKNSISLSSDEARIGLLNEYAQSVFRGVDYVIKEEKEFPRCVITFNCAVHGVVGSSELLFYKLSKTVTKLLINYPNSKSIESFFKLME